MDADQHIAQLKEAMERYKHNRLQNGDNLEDIMDDLEDAASSKVYQWCEENPINLH